MQVIILGLLLIVSQNLSAKTVTVTHAMRSHTLEYDVKTLSIKGPGLDFTLTKSACNESMLRRFEGSVRQALRPPVKNMKPFDYSIKVESGADVYYESMRTKGATFLMKLPEVFQELKLQDKYKCGAKP